MGGTEPDGRSAPHPRRGGGRCLVPEGGGGTKAGCSPAGDVVRKGSRLAGRPWEEFGAPRPAPFPFYQKVSRSITRPLNSRGFQRINFESLTF